MSLLQKLFDTDFWKQRVKVLSRDLNTTHDKLCECETAFRSALKRAHSLEAENISLRLQLANVQKPDVQIADLEKKLEATKYYTNKYQQAFYRGTDYNDKLVEENESLKEQLQTAISNYDERDNRCTTLETAHIKLGAELDKREQEIARLTREKEAVEADLTVAVQQRRSAEEDVRDLKAEVQIAEDDFDEVANLYTGLQKAFGDLVDTNVDLNKKLREATSYKATYENIKAQLHTLVDERIKRDTEYKTLSEQYDKLHEVNEALTAEIAKLKTVSGEWDNMYKGYVTATNENAKLRKDVTELTTKVAKLQLEKSALHERLTTEKDSLSKTLAEAMFKNEQSERRISELSTALKDCDTYKDLAINLNEDYVRLINKVKAVQEVVKVLEPVSMKFQTVLFDLLADTNVPRT